MNQPFTPKCILRSLYTLLLVFAFTLSFNTVQAQGRVLINEYLPWPNNACGVTAEFIELFNFGPGPVNISGYIITDGDYAITIPANTTLLPGQFYVLAGQSVIPQNCGNDLRNVTVDLNWATCGCTSQPIPVTGDGLFTDGGGSNEQVVLLDSNLRIIDAIVRNTPVEPSSSITTSAVGGQFTPRTFDLDNMNVPYETIGESVGRGNSLARKIDGGCGWLKDTQESAGDKNNTTGGSYGWTGTLQMTRPNDCSGAGSVNITVSDPSLFPMTYMLAKDIDANHTYDLNDQYQYGIDSTAADIPITGLAAGTYRVVIESQFGCDVTQFDFSILGCNNMLLNDMFKDIVVITSSQEVVLAWKVPNRQMVKTFYIEESYDGRTFTPYLTIQDTDNARFDQQFFATVHPKAPLYYYRIRLITTEGAPFYSKVITVQSGQDDPFKAGLVANPFEGSCKLSIETPENTTVLVRLVDLVGRPVLKLKMNVQRGSNIIQLPTQQVTKGMYILQVSSKEGRLMKTLKCEKR